ncbi:hypothetical protein JO972_05000 [Verrucomicrobiaceae bacterium 5K15]|uniref:Uncharacterized protein n=1 Tax=Oceaniferula flava TaxID=2800421 RepID=A0AAE2SBB5_9BACT|nr:hypothetical protein [Oceaniferula flavus]MBK1854302.1 hypothetical protein [Oceaniferula flavus]MBM1135608.1 hypothetical protein [Oceaniferula flavus]
MKITTITTMAALLMGAASAVAQDTAYTKPAGFVTHTVSPGLNMLGLTLHEPIAVAGVLGSLSGDDIATNISDLSASLGDSDSDSKVIIEITDGDNDGLIIEATSWSGSSFTNIPGLDASLEGDSFQVRWAPSISDLFGSDNSKGFKAGDLQTADVIWISNGTGGFDKYYYSEGDPGAFPVPVTAGWKNSVGGDAANTRINYMDGIFIQRRENSDLDLVFTGAVKTTKTLLDLRGGGAYNYYSGIFPASTTLSDSNLQAVLTHGDLTNGDVVWMPSDVGAWNKFTYRDEDPAAFPVPVTEGWKDSVGGDASDVEMTSGFIIQRRGAAVNAPYEPNDLYDNL